MIKCEIFVKNTDTLAYDRVDLFQDEKISVTSSIQNINDISKTFCDFSQTFTIPASPQNNKIFKHWYDNSRLIPFSTLIRADGRIELDGIVFRVGKIQLESCEMENGNPKSYAINFIGLLLNLKDIFAGKFLSDLNTTQYDFLYSSTIVLNKITNATIGATIDPISFPLITSNNLWTYGSGSANYNINQNNHPIYYNDLFPSVNLGAMLEMISYTFGISFIGNFKNDNRFKYANLWLKNAETFVTKEQITKIDYSTITSNNIPTGYQPDTVGNKVTNITAPSSYGSGTFTGKSIYAYITPSTSGKLFSFHIYKNGIQIFVSPTLTSTAGVQVGYVIESTNSRYGTNDYFEVYIGTYDVFTFTAKIIAQSDYETYSGTIGGQFILNASSQSTPTFKLQLSQYMPNMKIEDFFTGILKMFNLTCYSENGRDYIIEQLDSYYDSGIDRDLTPYIKTDKKTLNRVKTYKKINFEYDKSESYVNQAFLSNAGFDYGSLYYSTTPPADGDEYSIKLPFENLNFINLSGNLQVGYCLKTDYKTYIPKPIILYDYNPATITTTPTFHFSTNTTGNATNALTQYRAFGQEYNNGTKRYGLNFNTQQSTLTNEIVTNGLYLSYYSKYLNNIYSFKARFLKVSAVLPISVILSLKLNDSIFIRGDKFIINTVTFDMTTGETEFELLTDQRI